jgi:hypothetical protein
MTNAMSNWIELGLSADEDKLVREAAKIYQSAYVHTLDSVFKIAKAIDILHERHYGSGVQGGFADALVQYGFTARDGESALDKGIRSNLKELLENEPQVRAWWGKVEERKKKDWVSARAIYRNWKKSQAPAATDPNAPPRQSPYEKLKVEKDALVKHNIELKRQLEAREDGDTFSAEKSTPREIATALYGQLAPYKDKAKKVAIELMALIEPKAKPAKVKKRKGKAAPAEQPDQQTIVAEAGSVIEPEPEPTTVKDKPGLVWETEKDDILAALKITPEKPKRGAHEDMLTTPTWERLEDVELRWWRGKDSWEAATPWGLVELRPVKADGEIQYRAIFDVEVIAASVNIDECKEQARDWARETWKGRHDS